MTKKELEHKITKALHKANHAKSLKLKLEKVNDVVDVVQTLLAGVSADTQDAAAQAQAETSSKRLEQYSELCRIHKLKFQLDALLHGVVCERRDLAKQPGQMTQEHFDSIARRLNVVLDTDPEHPEALELLEQLNGNYPQYAENSCVRDAYIDLSRQHQAAELTVSFECPSTLITQNKELAAEYSKYQGSSASSETDDSETTRLQFSLHQLDAFAGFHGELHTSAQYKVFINGKRVKETLFTEWFHCYRRCLKADKPQYCYGASPFTLNVFGCHKLSQPDIAGRLDQCWFQHGMLDQESGLFLIASEQIARKICRRLGVCEFCPFLSEEKLHLGMGLLPQYINPECDKQWDYLYENTLRVGVVPSGSEIAIARHPLEGDKIDPSDLIEVDSSPYARRMLEYINTQDKRVLSESRYKGITRCMNCGTYYKAHTMDCPNCKSDFVQGALENLDKVLRELSYIQPVKYPSPSAPSSAPSRRDDIPKVLDSQKSVSFEQLWDDPQIREILSNELAEEPVKDSPKAPKNMGNDAVPLAEAMPQHTLETTEPQKDLNTPYDVPERTIRQPQSSGRFDLHGKLRSLVSKKYRERKAIENAFSGPEDFTLSPPPERQMPSGERFEAQEIPLPPPVSKESLSELDPSEAYAVQDGSQEVDEELLDAIKRLKPRQRSELSKRGVVRVIYHATMDKEQCPLCAYLDEMVMDPDDPSTDIFSPPLYLGCTCNREYILKTEKPSNWPEVSFQFPPKELLSYIQKH
ncbi:MAG: hypothetical protein GY801_43990 [bacterium]|nr:hypothetical protein [bacterium]